MSLGRTLALLSMTVTLSACATANSAGVARPSPFPEPAGRPAIFQPVPAPAPSGVEGPSGVDGPSTIEAPPVVRSFSTSSLLASAEKLRGIPYQLGGDSPKTGFDCSGYTQYVYGLYRIALPRTVAEQFHAGKPASGAIRPGDLLFFRMSGPKSPVSHVALALGNDEFIHAPGADGAVRNEKLSPYWRSRLVTVRRVL
jgi:cell wall-associated NlpC family hydrolase